RNSSVYCLLLPINTSVIAINYGNRMSTKGWPVHSTAPALTPNTLLIEPPENKKTCFYAGGRRETGLAQIHVKKSAKNHKSFLGNHQRQTHLEQYGTWTYNKKLYILKVKIKTNAVKSKP
ncbi:hypothetical protein, partial [Pseudomonas aeruginosa]|uniref:hypothetical protein n=1 Tax=Pseudomonas aeruginosa TaxID=287 RepID=UPI001F39ABCD